MQQAFVLLFAVFLLQESNIFANPTVVPTPENIVTTETNPTESTTPDAVTIETQPDDDDVAEEIPSTHVPHLMSTTEAKEATQGQSVTFPCNVDDLGEFVLMWKRENNRMLFAGDLRIIRDDRISINGTSLHISHVNPKDSGEYTCQISTNPPIELPHSLDVLYPPTIKPRSKDVFITAKEGESVTLTCDATGNPVPRITWKHANRHYDSFEESNYVINNAQKNDSGEYECIADNSVGDPASAVISVDIVSAPKITTEPEDGVLVVKEGEPISISCDATGDPKPVITWKKPNADKMMKVHDGNKIMINKATHVDAGTYECIANNSLGISTTAVIRVQVLYAPKVEMSHARIHAREGASVNITCLAEGEPVPTVIWTKEGSTVHHSNDHHLKLHGHSHMLLIHNVKETDFGVYECTARNTLSSASGSTHLMGTPQVPSFTSKSHGTQGTKYTASWMVNSHIPIDEYSLMYRKSSAEEWETHSVPAEMTTGGLQEPIQMFQLADLKPNTEYEVAIKARNKFGWSEQSASLLFTTRNEDSPIPTPSEERVTDISMPEKKDKHMENLSSSSYSFSISISSLLMFTIFIRQLH